MVCEVRNFLRVLEEFSAPGGLFLVESLQGEHFSAKSGGPALSTSPRGCVGHSPQFLQKSRFFSIALVISTEKVADPPFPRVSPTKNAKFVKTWVFP